MLLIWYWHMDCWHTLNDVSINNNTRLMALFPGLPSWAGTRKVKPIWILLKQETVGGSGINRATCKSAPRSRQITTPAPHHSSFLQAGCPSCCPTNSIKALKMWVNVQKQITKTTVILWLRFFSCCCCWKLTLTVVLHYCSVLWQKRVKQI